VFSLKKKIRKKPDIKIKKIEDNKDKKKEQLGCFFLKK